LSLQPAGGEERCQGTLLNRDKENYETKGTGREKRGSEK